MIGAEIICNVSSVLIFPHSQLSQNSVGSQNGQRSPIDYFTQYFDWKTWQDFANITAKTSKMSHPVTAKEVSQFVGMHIAMGTLQVSDEFV